MGETSDQQRRSLAALAATPGWAGVCAASGMDDETAAAVLSAAGQLAEGVMIPLDVTADREGCRMEGGRVRVPGAYHGAWAAYAAGGWIGLDLPEALGGSGLPVSLQAMAAQIFDRACPAFNMATGASRSGAVLLAERAPELAAEWVPALIAGERAATICISEPGAGSDVGRLRTRAVREDGVWRVTGQKIWISFGDHDLVPRIGHCLLARTSDQPGTRGISLFLVPNLRADGGDNGVTPVRIEEKMGLHGSPTCVLAFEGAEAHLIGEVDRGLPQLFTMIELMRLQTGGQGLGLATRACDVAEAYAQERAQGGDPRLPPVPIARHPDVQRQLAQMRARTEVLRAAVAELGCTMDLARGDPAGSDTDAGAYAAFLLPLIKTFGAETGFDVANRGIQVLGGAGYTAEWPLERAARDARVLSIYEGTTGMQALDFLERRTVKDRAGLEAFLSRAEALEGPGAEVITRFAALARALPGALPDGRLWIADDWLRCGWLALTALLAPRVAQWDATAAEAVTAQIVERFEVHASAVRAAL